MTKPNQNKKPKEEGKEKNIKTNKSSEIKKEEKKVSVKYSKKEESQKVNNSKVAFTVLGLAVLVLIVLFILFLGRDKGSIKEVNSIADLTNLATEVYSEVKDLPKLETREVDITNPDETAYNLGLENGNELEYAVISEPLMSSQAYSLILVKVKEGVSADAVAEKMFNGVNPSKWICVTAEKVYATSSGDIVMLIMTEEEKVDNISKKFKKMAGTIGKVYERNEQI